MKETVRNAIVRLLFAAALFTAVAAANVAYLCDGGNLYMWTIYGWVYAGSC